MAVAELKRKLRFRTKTYGRTTIDFLVPKGKEVFSISFTPEYPDNIVLPSYCAKEFFIDDQIPDYVLGEWGGKTYKEFFENHPLTKKGIYFEDKAFSKEHYSKMVTENVKSKKEELTRLEQLVTSVGPQVKELEDQKAILAQEVATMRAELKALSANAPKELKSKVNKGDKTDVS